MAENALTNQRGVLSRPQVCHPPDLPLPPTPIPPVRLYHSFKFDATKGGFHVANEQRLTMLRQPYDGAGTYYWLSSLQDLPDVWVGFFLWHVATKEWAARIRRLSYNDPTVDVSSPLSPDAGAFPYDTHLFFYDLGAWIGTGIGRVYA